MKANIMLVSEGVSIDQTTNNATIYNILERLSSKSIPIFSPQMYVFTLLEKEDSEENNFNCILQIFNNKQKLFQVEVNPNFKRGKRNRTVIRIGGIAIPSPGELIFNFVCNEKILSFYKIEIVKIGESEGEVIDST
jgi:hypothetical protein